MIGDIFTLVLLDPMMNLLVLLNNVLFGNFGLGIIAFTILVRVATFPLTLRQLHQTRAMQELSPKIQDIQKRYPDARRRQQETMALYRESGVNPIGCLGPFVIQIPIFLALFYAIRQTLPESPEALERLATHLYPWEYLQHAIPLGTHFLGMDLRYPNFIMVILVGATSWAQSKTQVTPVLTDQQRMQQQMMTVMLPFMFAFFALSFPSGVSLYWVVNALVAVASNIVIYGLPIANIQPLVKAPAPKARKTSPPPDAPSQDPPPETRNTSGTGRNKRQNRRRRV